MSHWAVYVLMLTGVALASLWLPYFLYRLVRLLLTVLGVLRRTASQPREQRRAGMGVAVAHRHARPDHYVVPAAAP
jgi:hypothetical protein